jgi:hypothetical protein
MSRVSLLASCVVVAGLAFGASTGDAQRAAPDSIMEGIHIEPRMAPEHAIRTMTSGSGNFMILHVDGAVVLQVSDAGIERIRPRSAGDRRHPLVRIREEFYVLLPDLLHRAVVYDFSRLGDVRWQDGEIVFVDRTGRRVFADFFIQGENVLRSFDEAEARGFIEHLQRTLRAP